MTKQALIELAGHLQAELDAAPNFRVGTYWWDSRIAELQRIHEQINNR